MVSNYLIGLREGLEAALVVSILITYLVRTDRRSKIPYVWGGVFGAVAFSALFGALLTFTQLSLLNSDEAQETFAGAMSFIAVALVTWMIIWMRNTSKRITAELQGKLESAISGGVIMVAVMAFVAVAREGLETALFLFTSIQAAGTTLVPTIGFALGILTAIVIGYLLYKGAVKINLKNFFTVTGYFLILVAAGVLTYAIHEFQEVGILPGEDSLAFDVSSTISTDTWFGTLAKGIFNFSPETSWLQAIGWVAYVAFAVWIFNRKAPVSTTKVGVPLKQKVSESVK